MHREENAKPRQRIGMRSSNCPTRLKYLAAQQKRTILITADLHSALSRKSTQERTDWRRY